MSVGVGSGGRFGPDLVDSGPVATFAAELTSVRGRTRPGLSIKKIVRTLRPLQQVNVRMDGHDHLAEDPLNETACQILDTLDLNPQ